MLRLSVIVHIRHRRMLIIWIWGIEMVTVIINRYEFGDSCSDYGLLCCHYDKRYNIDKRALQRGIGEPLSLVKLDHFIRSLQWTRWTCCISKLAKQAGIILSVRFLITFS